MNELPPSRLSVCKLGSGHVFRAGYRRRGTELLDRYRFVGFKVGEELFTNLKTLKANFGERNLFRIESVADQRGLTVTAVFHDDEDEGGYWAAYLWKGCFRVGSSADPLVLETV